MTNREELQVTIEREALKTLIKEAVRETLLEMLADEEAELEFEFEILDRLPRFRREKLH